MFYAGKHSPRKLRCETHERPHRWTKDPGNCRVTHESNLPPPRTCRTERKQARDSISRFKRPGRDVPKSERDSVVTEASLPPPSLLAAQGRVSAALLLLLLFLAQPSGLLDTRTRVKARDDARQLAPRLYRFFIQVGCIYCCLLIAGGRLTRVTISRGWGGS
jgi:hypothetical protein